MVRQATFGWKANRFNPYTADELAEIDDLKFVVMSGAHDDWVIATQLADAKRLSDAGTKAYKYFHYMAHAQGNTPALALFTADMELKDPISGGTMWRGSAANSKMFDWRKQSYFDAAWNAVYSWANSDGVYGIALDGAHIYWLEMPGFSVDQVLPTKKLETWFTQAELDDINDAGQAFIQRLTDNGIPVVANTMGGAFQIIPQDRNRAIWSLFPIRHQEFFGITQTTGVPLAKTYLVQDITDMQVAGKQAVTATLIGDADDETTITAETKRKAAEFSLALFAIGHRPGNTFYNFGSYYRITTSWPLTYTMESLGQPKADFYWATPELAVREYDLCTVAVNVSDDGPWKHNGLSLASKTSYIFWQNAEKRRNYPTRRGLPWLRRFQPVPNTDVGMQDKMQMTGIYGGNRREPGRGKRRKVASTISARLGTGSSSGIVKVGAGNVAAARVTT